MLREWYHTVMTIEKHKVINHGYECSTVGREVVGKYYDSHCETCGFYFRHNTWERVYQEISDYHARFRKDDCDSK